jgi:CBS domain-containing protein
MEPNGHGDGIPRLGSEASVKDALSILLTSGGQPLAVTDGEDRIKGLVTLAHLERVIAEDAKREGSAG